MCIKILDFVIAAFFRHLHGKGKKAAISNLRNFLTEQRRSYIDCALDIIRIKSSGRTMKYYSRQPQQNNDKKKFFKNRKFYFQGLTTTQ